MQYCPKCENKGFEPSEKFSKPLINKGGKKNFKGFSIRYYACINCGARFKTIEEFYEDIDDAPLFNDLAEDNSNE